MHFFFSNAFKFLACPESTTVKILDKCVYVCRNRQLRGKSFSRGEEEAQGHWNATESRVPGSRSTLSSESSPPSPATPSPAAILIGAPSRQPLLRLGHPCSRYRDVAASFSPDNFLCSDIQIRWQTKRHEWCKNWLRMGIIRITVDITKLS